MLGAIGQQLIQAVAMLGAGFEGMALDTTLG